MENLLTYFAGFAEFASIFLTWLLFAAAGAYLYSKVRFRAILWLAAYNALSVLIDAPFSARLRIEYRNEPRSIGLLHAQPWVDWILIRDGFSSVIATLLIISIVIHLLTLIPAPSSRICGVSSWMIFPLKKRTEDFLGIVVVLFQLVNPLIWLVVVFYNKRR